MRNNWLNPPEWTREEVLEFPGSADGPWARYVTDPDARGIGTVRYPRVVPLSAECARELKARTLTALYNARPTWLELAHRRLDAAVLAAYGWPEDVSDDALLAQFFTPPLTTIRQDALRKGSMAAEILLRQLHGEAIPGQPEQQLLPTHLTVRGTTGPMRPADERRNARQSERTLRQSRP